MYCIGKSHHIRFVAQGLLNLSLESTSYGLSNVALSCKAPKANSLGCQRLEREGKYMYMCVVPASVGFFVV